MGESNVEVLKAKSEEHIEEIALARLTEEDLWKLSQESLSVWSWTGFRLGLIMFVHGCNQVSLELNIICFEFLQELTFIAGRFRR